MFPDSESFSRAAQVRTLLLVGRSRGRSLNQVDRYVTGDFSYKHFPSLPIHKEALTASWLCVFGIFSSDGVSGDFWRGGVSFCIYTHTVERNLLQPLVPSLRQVADYLNLRFLVHKMTTSLTDSLERLNKMVSVSHPHNVWHTVGVQ